MPRYKPYIVKVDNFATRAIGVKYFSKIIESFDNVKSNLNRKASSIAKLIKIASVMTNFILFLDFFLFLDIMDTQTAQF